MDETDGGAQSPGTHPDGSVGDRESSAGSAPGPGLTARVALSHPEFALASIGRRVAGTRLFVVEFSERSDGTAIAFVEVESENPPDFEGALADADGIVQWEAVTEAESQRLYGIHLDGVEPRLRRVCADAGVHVSRMATHGDGWLLDLRLPDREALTGLAARWREAGVSFELKRIARTPLGKRTGPLAGLTAEQYELLRTAHQNGYFEVPRGASQVDLAEELDVSTSGFSQRIRRALDALLDGVFEGE